MRNRRLTSENMVQNYGAEYEYLLGFCTMKIGYARVSTDDQETHLQIDALGWNTGVPPRKANAYQSWRGSLYRSKRAEAVPDLPTRHRAGIDSRSSPCRA